MLKIIENLCTWVFTCPVPNHLQNFENKHSYMTNEDTEHQRGRYLSRAISTRYWWAKICFLDSQILKLPNFQVDLTVILANCILPNVRLSLRESIKVKREPFIFHALNWDEWISSKTENLGHRGDGLWVSPFILVTLKVNELSSKENVRIGRALILTHEWWGNLSGDEKNDSIPLIINKSWSFYLTLI